MTNKERYATLDTWVETFVKEEGIRIARNTISNRVKVANVVGRTARKHSGRLVKRAFYAESDVRQVCSDLLEDLPVADEAGFIEKNDQRYAVRETWAKEFRVSATLLRRVFSRTPVASIRGRNRDGKVLDFFAESDVSGLLFDAMQELPTTDQAGFVEMGGRRYGTTGAWSRELGISEITINKKVRMIKNRALQARISTGNTRLLYAESDIRELLADQLVEVPVADAHGFFEKDDELYGTVGAWSKRFNFSKSSIRRLLKSCPIPCIQGRVMGRKINFYAEVDVRRLLAGFLVDRTESVPTVNEDGFLEIEGQLFSTFNNWAKVIGVSPTGIVGRLRKSPLPSIAGKARNGLICHLYAEADIRRICADLITKPKKE